MSRQSVALLGIAAIFAAMLGRMGWIDWIEVLGAIGLVVGVILALLAAAAVFIALPVFLLLEFIKAFIPLGKPKPPTPAPAE